MRRSQSAATVNVDEGSSRKKAGIGLDSKDRTATGRGVEGMGHYCQQFRAVRENSRLSARQSATGGDRQTLSEGNSGRSYEEASIQELSRGDRTEEIAGRVADELGRGPFRRRHIDAVPGDCCDRAGV